MNRTEGSSFAGGASGREPRTESGDPARGPTESDDVAPGPMEADDAAPRSPAAPTVPDDGPVYERGPE